MPWTMVAVAIGNSPDRTIIDWSNLGGVRPYIPGLMQKLANLGYRIGTDYSIFYRERPEATLASAFTPPAGVTFDVMFCMSTTVVRAAASITRSTPVVGIVSDPADEEFTAQENLCGVSAKRKQTAGDCLDRFLRTVPTLTEVRVLHKPKYGPSEAALGHVSARGSRRGKTITPIPVNNATDIDNALNALTPRNTSQQATIGLLVLPIDVCFAKASDIISVAQQTKNLPTFFPTTDWVKSGALGGYGVPQCTCGQLLAERVDYVRRHNVPLPPPRFTEAPDHSFEWWASSAAAQALNITLGPEVPRVT